MAVTHRATAAMTRSRDGRPLRAGRALAGI